MNVLVTDGAYRNTLAIVRSLGKSKANVCVLWHNRIAKSFYSRYCQRRIIGPDPSIEHAYIQSIRNLVEHGHFDLLIPVGFRATEIISKNRRDIEQFVNIEIADYESISIALNKRRTYELAGKLGIPFPETKYPRTFREAESISKSTAFPVVIKALSEQGETVVDYVGNREDFMRKYHKMCKQYDFGDSALPMIQEYINGDPYTYGFAALYQHGLCKRIYMHKEIRSYPAKGGVGACLESYYDHKLRDSGIELLGELNWHGVALVEFRKNINGEYYLMEINPKFWASLDIALAAGVDFPYCLYRIANGEDLDYSEEYDRSLRFHFPLDRELLHLRQEPSSIISVISDTLSPSVKSNVWLSDIKPNIIELMITLFNIFLSFVPGRFRRRLVSWLMKGNLSSQRG